MVPNLVLKWCFQAQEAWDVSWEGIHVFDKLGSGMSHSAAGSEFNVDGNQHYTLQRCL